MTKRKRRNHSSKFKANVALEALREEMTMSELAEKYDLHANQISHWKSDLVSGAEDVFGGHEQNKKDSEAEIDKLHSKIGELTMVPPGRFFVKSARSLSKDERKQMIRSSIMQGRYGESLRI